jgi:hypothetical protein
MCVDDSFADERPSAEKLENGLWTYPQQLISHRLIDANLYWLSKKEVQITHHSSGPKFNHAAYIQEEGIKGFFA